MTIPIRQKEPSKDKAEQKRKRVKKAVLLGVIATLVIIGVSILIKQVLGQ